MLGEREQVLIEHAATIREAALARARDEGERDQLAVERARAESQAGRRDDLALRVLGHPLREADEAALETVQIADLQAAATRCERAMPAASAAWRMCPAAAVGAAAVLCCVLAALAVAAVGPRARAGRRRARSRPSPRSAWSRARRGTRTMRAALAERSAGGSDLVASLGDLRVAESRIAHPDHTLVSDIEQLRAYARAGARDAAPGSSWSKPSCTRPSAARRSRPCSAPTTRSASRRSSRPPSGATPRPPPRASGPRELLPRAAASAEERVQSVGDRLAELERLVRSASPAGDEADALERLHAAATRRVAADQRERSLVEGVPELDALLATAREREARGERLLLSDDEHATLVAELREARARAEELMLREQELSAGARPARSGAHGRRRRGRAARRRGRARDRPARARPAGARGRHRAPRRARGAGALRPGLAAGSEPLPGSHHARPLQRHRDRGDTRRRARPGGDAGGRAMPVRVGPPLSRGTLEQIYVAVRLALVDAIDAEARLPIFLDELFAHWDASRLDALVRVLGAVEGRQVHRFHLPRGAGRPARALVRRARDRAGGPGGVLVQRPLRRLAVATAAPEQEGPDPARPARGLSAGATARASSGGSKRR